MKKMKRFAGPEGSMIGGAEDERPAPTGMSEATQLAPEVTVINEKTGVKGDKGNRIVTKEELKASGLSLRDFLNKERGLTRRGESAPAKPAAKAEMAPSKPAPKAEEPAKSAPKTSETKRGFGPYGVFAGPSDEEKAATYARYEENRKKMGATAAPSGSSKIADSDYAKSVRSSQAASADSGPLGKRIREALGSSYKTGGSVSKASSRADGIAQRGKTRGKMC
jgi:hypothetical protein